MARMTTSAERNGFPTGGHGTKVSVPKFQEILGQELLETGAFSCPVSGRYSAKVRTVFRLKRNLIHENTCLTHIHFLKISEYFVFMLR